MYSFRDTVRSQSASQNRGAESFKINGTYLEDSVPGYRTLSVSGRELLDSEINLLSIQGVSGEEFLGKRRPTRNIVVKYSINAETSEAFRDSFNKLSQILDADEAHLIFDDEPDKYFVGTCYDVGDVPDGRNAIVSTFTFLCADPFKHSTTERTFKARANADDILEAEIINDGSESVPISYEITHNHENGYVGIVSEDGVIQYGSVTEQDTEDKHSEVLLKYSKATDFGAMTSGKGILASNDNFPMNGTLGAYDAGLALKDAGSGSGWHGGARQVTLPADVNGETGATNFKAMVNVQFETSKISETGLLEFVIGDTDGNHLASIHIVKASTSDSRCSAIFQVQAVEKGRKKYEPNSQSFTNSKNGQMYIQKSGEQFDFWFGGENHPFRVPEAKDKKALTITVFLGKYGNNATVNAMMFKSMSFQKNNVEYVVDIPNRYQEGDVITVDGETTKMYVNGIPSLDDEVKGAKYFKAKPGTTKVQFYVSDFCNPLPEITAKIREAWL